MQLKTFANTIIAAGFLLVSVPVYAQTATMVPDELCKDLSGTKYQNYSARVLAAAKSFRDVCMKNLPDARDAARDNSAAHSYLFNSIPDGAPAGTLRQLLAKYLKAHDAKDATALPLKRSLAEVIAEFGAWQHQQQTTGKPISKADSDAFDRWVAPHLLMYTGKESPVDVQLVDRANETIRNRTNLETAPVQKK